MWSHWPCRFLLTIVNECLCIFSRNLPVFCECLGQIHKWFLLIISMNNTEKYTILSLSPLLRKYSGQHAFYTVSTTTFCADTLWGRSDLSFVIWSQTPLHILKMMAYVHDIDLLGQYSLLFVLIKWQDVSSSNCLFNILYIMWNEQKYV